VVVVFLPNFQSSTPEFTGGWMGSNGWRIWAWWRKKRRINVVVGFGLSFTELFVEKWWCGYLIVYTLFTRVLVEFNKNALRMGVKDF
jgi:hypothetical protein